MTMLDRVKLSYAEAAAIIAKPTPYVFAGGHNVEFAPSLSYANGIGAKGAGYDCSSFSSAVLRAGGVLAIPRAVLPLDTADILTWGLPSRGEFLTVWVCNDAEVKHVFLEFHGFPNSFCEAPHTGALCHWFTNADTSTFTARHWSRT